MKTVLVELTGTARSSTSPDEGYHRKSLRLLALCVWSRWMNVRRGACEAQTSLRNASAYFHFYSWGQGLAIGGYRLESLWAWTVIISTVHAPRLCLQRKSWDGLWAATDHN